MPRSSKRKRATRLKPHSSYKEAKPCRPGTCPNCGRNEKEAKEWRTQGLTPAEIEAGLRLCNACSQYWVTHQIHRGPQYILTLRKGHNQTSSASSSTSSPSSAASPYRLATPSSPQLSSRPLSEDEAAFILCRMRCGGKHSPSAPKF